MELSKITTGVICLVVGIMVTFTLLIPVIDDVTHTEDTFTNEGLWRMSAIKDGDVWTRDPSIENLWSFNGSSEVLPSLGNSALLGDNWCIRSNGQGRGETLSGNASSLSATAGEIDITLTGLGGSSVQSLPGYGWDPNGSYLMKNWNADTYVLGDSIIYGTGASSVGDTGVIIHVEGTVNDGATVTVMQNSGGATISNVVVSDVVVNAVAVEGYDSLYKFTSITANVSLDATVGGTTSSQSGSIVYNMVVVPYEVTAELSNHTSSMNIAVIAIIPLLVIVALVMVAVRMISGRSD